MRFSSTKAAATALLAGVAIAEPLTTIDPCPGATSTTVQPITVTKQYQTVSTCETTSACFRGSCVTKYPMETYAYVSTVIPCAWDGKNAEVTTVTSTTQDVTVSRFQSTITKWVTPTPVVHNGTTSVATATPLYLTIAKDFAAPYNKIGPLAIPGYGGSGLCKECEVQKDGSRSQIVDVVECRAGPGGAKCMGYEETWISKPAPSTKSVTAQACSTKFVAPTAGVYTFTFPFMAPAKTITADGALITVGPSPYFVHATRRCHRAHETIDFTTTITKTIYWTVPCSRQPPKTSSVLPVPTGSHAFPGWPKHPGHNSVGNNNGGGDAFGWADWGSDNAANPNAPFPSQWADWIKTATETVTNTVTISPSPATTTSYTSSIGPIDGSTTTSSMASTTSVDSTTSMTTSTSFTSSIGPIDGSTTTSSMASTTSVDSTTSMTTSTSFSSSIGPIEGSTTSSVTSTTSVDSSTSMSTSSFSSSSSIGPIEGSTTSSVDSTTSTGASSTTTSFDSTTTSFDSTTTSFLSTTTSVDATTTSTTATASMTAIPVNPGQFVIGVNAANARYHKRALNYVTFVNGDATLVADKLQATIFTLTSEGFLMVGSLFVDADTTQSYIAFSLTATPAVTVSKFQLDPVTLVLSLVSANNGFCVAVDNSLFIIFDQDPPFSCTPVILVAEAPAVPVSTTTSATVTPAPTTTSASVFVPTSTTSLDPSADLDLDVPQATGVRRRGVQYGARKYYHHRH